MVLVLLVVGFTARPPAGAITRADVVRAETLAARLAGPRDVGPVGHPDRQGEVVPGRFTIGFEPGASGAAVDWLTSLGAEIVRVDDAGHFVVARFGHDSGMLERLADLAQAVPSVSYVEPSYREHSFLIPDDPMFWGYQWDKWVMYADKAWDATRGDASLKVGVVDGGCDYKHPDLCANFRTGELGYDFVGGDSDPMPDSPDAQHATHVCGIIAATVNNAIGIAGWARVQLLSVRVLDDSGRGYSDDCASGIRWAADNGCRIINMSFGSKSYSTPKAQACRHAESLGVLLVASAGNDGSSEISYAAALPECIAVGAIDEVTEKPSFSNYGEELEVVAPGVAVMSTIPDSGYVAKNGTSMAAPQVAGVAALVMARNPALPAILVRAILSASALDIGDTGPDTLFGSGLVCAQRALDLAAAAQGRAVPGAVPGPGKGTAIVREIVLPAWAESGRLYDGSGRFVTDLRPESSAPGPGVYFLVAVSGNRQERTRLVLAR